MTLTNELEAAIKRAGITKREIARKLGLSEMGLYKKIHNETEFKASEIMALSQLLNLLPPERDKIFFATIGD